MTARTRRVLGALALGSLVVHAGCARGCTSSRPPIHLNPSMTEKRYTPILAATAIAIPALAAANVYVQMNAPLQPPYFPRTVHPASPSEITVHEKKIDLDAGDNPFRQLEKSNPQEFRTHVENGRRVFYRNCVFCHGDNMRTKTQERIEELARERAVAAIDLALVEEGIEIGKRMMAEMIATYSSSGASPGVATAPSSATSEGAPAREAQAAKRSDYLNEVSALTARPVDG